VWFFFWAHIYNIIFWNRTFIETIPSNIPNIVIYSTAIFTVIYLQVVVKPIRRGAKAPISAETLEDLQRENELLRRKLLNSKKIPSKKIGIAFLITGILALFVSFIISSTFFAFVGLSLTFWGALFLFARPTKFVRRDILNNSTLSSYYTIDRIVNDLNYQGKSVYIPSYPKEGRLPQYLEGLKEMVVFISAKDATAIPTVSELAEKQFLVKNPKGVCVTPPGVGLAGLFEADLGVTFSKIDLEDFYNRLPTSISKNLELASNFEINTENDLTHVIITDSVYKSLYSAEHKLKSVYTIGCPLVSAIACALANVTGKLVTIAKSNVSPDLKFIEMWYQTLEG